MVQILMMISDSGLLFWATRIENGLSLEVFMRALQQ